MTSTCSGSSAWGGVRSLGCDVSLIFVSLSLDDLGGAVHGAAANAYAPGQEQLSSSCPVLSLRVSCDEYLNMRRSCEVPLEGEKERVFWGRGDDGPTCTAPLHP